MLRNGRKNKKTTRRSSIKARRNIKNKDLRNKKNNQFLIIDRKSIIGQCSKYEKRIQEHRGDLSYNKNKARRNVK